LSCEILSRKFSKICIISFAVRPNLSRSVQSGLIRSAAMKLLLAFLRNQSAATAIEYAMLAAGVAAVIVAAVTGLGSSVSSEYSSVSAALK
jgi:pilus assembly protein Flp/PilA